MDGARGLIGTQGPSSGDGWCNGVDWHSSTSSGDGWCEGGA